MSERWRGREKSVNVQVRGPEEIGLEDQLFLHLLRGFGNIGQLLGVNAMLTPMRTLHGGPGPLADNVDTSYKPPVTELAEGRNFRPPYKPVYAGEELRLVKGKLTAVPRFVPVDSAEGQALIAGKIKAQKWN